MVDFTALAAPFSPDEVSWRIGSTTQDKTKGMALAYIDARVVMDRFDTVCGPGGWQATYPHAGQKTVCSIGVLCGDVWVWKANGAGDTDVEQEKGALSDAFKRAAVLWGVGRYLYDVGSPWVEIEQRGRSYVIKKTEYARLGRILREHQTIVIAGRGSITEAAREITEITGNAKSTYDLKRENDIATLIAGAKLAIGLCGSRMQLKEWWGENRDTLRKKLSDDQYQTVIDMVSERRDSLPALEAVA